VTADTLIADLRARGVTLVADGEYLRCRPKSALTAEDLEMLKVLKDEVLARLSEEDCILGLSLREFERSRQALELRVPWLEDSLWLVPRAGDVPTLVGEGIPRGRIWKVREMADLLSIPSITPTEIERIGRLKVEFGAEIISVTPEADEGVGG